MLHLKPCCILNFQNCYIYSILSDGSLNEAIEKVKKKEVDFLEEHADEHALVSACLSFCMGCGEGEKKTF